MTFCHFGTLFFELLDFLAPFLFQLELGLANQAMYLLDRITVMVMVHSTAFDRGCCLFLYGRCMAYPALQNLKTDFEGSKKGIVFCFI